MGISGSRPSSSTSTRRTAGMRVAFGGLVAALAIFACSGSADITGPGACAPTARHPDAIGCAYVYGKVTDGRGMTLDSIDGLVRMSDACACSSPRVEGDDNGVYAVVVHRLPRPAGFSDTATATVVALASAPKYPRHITGAAYFDTLQLVVRFAPIGAIPPPTEVNLRIPLP